MILYKDIEQKTEDWFRIKYGKIGGSTSKGLTVKTDTLLIEMLAARCEDFEPEVDSFENADMQRGNELEPIAIRETELYADVKLLNVGWVEHETIKMLGISPDGLNANSTIGCEVKCPGAKKHIETIKNNIIPLDHIPQCIHYFTVIDTLEELHFTSFRPENKFQPLFVKTITRDSVVDLGLKKKIEVEVIGKKGVPIKPKIETVPDLRTVAEWVLYSEEKANKMEIDLLNELEKLKF